MNHVFNNLKLDGMWRVLSTSYGLEVLTHYYYIRASPISSKYIDGGIGFDAAQLLL
jgi:hypothetical protein